MSYQSLNDLVEEIKSELLKLENQELSIDDIDAIQQNAQELYERLTVLKYTAIEKLVKEETTPEPASVPEAIAKEPIVEVPVEPEVAEQVEKPIEAVPIRFNMKPVEIEEDEIEVAENQTNLLDEIKERVTEVVEVVEVVEVKKTKPKEEAKASLNDKLAASSEPLSLADKLKKQPITNLASSIGMNQKFLFMNDLFQGERDAFHESISELDSFDSYLDADNYIKNNLVNKYGWDLENPSAVRFMELVERRHLS
ncbi:MAG: hypothetical protein ACI9J3_003376 [Parvicellaceae bacterium]|jgi:hypothetical protein